MLKYSSYNHNVTSVKNVLWNKTADRHESLASDAAPSSDDCVNWTASGTADCTPVTQPSYFTSLPYPNLFTTAYSQQGCANKIMHNHKHFISMTAQEMPSVSSPWVPTHQGILSYHPLIESISHKWILVTSLQAKPQLSIGLPLHSLQPKSKELSAAGYSVFSSLTFADNYLVWLHHVVKNAVKWMGRQQQQQSQN